MRRFALLLALLIAASTGCADVDGPRWFDPGTAYQQRSRAQRFDPYPETEVGRSDGSARPREYLNPPPEADSEARSARTRAQQSQAGQPLRW